jgi:hypothetical protein
MIYDRVMGRILPAIAVATSIGCYHGAPASRDIDAAWRGRARAELEARWGRPAAETHEDQTYLRWTHEHLQFELPTAAAAISVGPGHAEGFAEVHAGAVWKTTTDAIATIDPAGVIADLRGPTVEWGPPDGANLHWGAIFGVHAGMGRLDDTGTPLPSGGLYLGGMLDPHFGLVGTYAFVSGTSPSGSAIGMAAGVAAQWFPIDRWSFRIGPAAVLSFSPGFASTHFTGGVDTCASFAVVRAGAFALDLRVDVVTAPGTAFGSVGVGVNRY